LYKTMSNLHS